MRLLAPLLAAAVCVALFATPAHARATRFTISSVECMPVARGPSARIQGFTATGSTQDVMKGGKLAGKVKLVEVLENNKVVGRGTNLKVTGEAAMSAKGIYFDMRVAIPGRDTLGVNITPQGVVELWTDTVGGKAKYRPYKANCRQTSNN